MSTGLLGPSGRPISSSDYKKDRPKAVGPSFGAWADRDTIFNQAPGGAILQFDLSALTLADYRAMRYHPQLNACLSVLTFMLHQVDWHLECDEQRLADEIEEDFRPVWTRLVRGLSQSFWSGFSPMVIEYDNDLNKNRVIITKFKDLYPEDCKVHWKTVEGSYAPPGKMKPKFKVFDGIDQWGFPFPIAPDNSLWYPLLMENGDYYGRKLLKAAFGPWYFSILIHLFANRYYERFGEPTPIGRAPFEDDFPIPDSDGKILTGKEAMERILMNLRNRSVVTLPSDLAPLNKDSTKATYEYDIEYLESQMRGADFERYLTRLDEEMSLALFTPLLLLRNADVGSHNLGVQHTQTWLWMLNALSGDMKEYIDRYPLARLTNYNYSPNAPRVRWVPSKMGKENTETLRAIITELLRSNKVKIDLAEMGQALGMTLTEVREVTSEDDPDEPPDPDKRIGRDRPGSSGPRGTGEPRATGKNISARIRQQVEKAFRDGNFNTSLKLSMGYHKRFMQSWVAEGIAQDAAESMTREFYDRVETWLGDAVSLDFSGANDFMSLFDRFLDTEIERLAS